jgi:hypothetical protein
VEKAKSRQAQSSGPIVGYSPKWTLGRKLFFSAHNRDFFSAIIYYYQKEVLLPNGNQNICSNEKLFYQNFEIIEWNY